MKPIIKVGSTRFWPAFDLQSFLIEIPGLAERFDFVVTDSPDFMFVSCYDGPMPAGRYQTIFFTGENQRAPLELYDWVIGSDHEDDYHNLRYLRLPLCALVCRAEELLNRSALVYGGSRRFCNFLYSRSTALREKFFGRLSQYKHVDAPGLSMFNGRCHSLLPRHHPHWRFGIPKFMEQYKFNIAFENSTYPGYTSEKIVHAMLGGCIPIYWGNSEIGLDFNEDAIIILPECSSDEDLAIQQCVDLVAKTDSCEETYRARLNQPWFPDNRIPNWWRKETIVTRFEQIFGI